MSEDEKFQEAVNDIVQEGEAIAAIGKILRTLDRRSALKVLAIAALRYDLYNIAREILTVLETQEDQSEAQRRAVR